MKPQYIKIDQHGTMRYFLDKDMTVVHRLDGPAIIFADGSAYWYLNGFQYSKEDFDQITTESLTLGEFWDVYNNFINMDYEIPNYYVSNITPSYRALLNVERSFGKLNKRDQKYVEIQSNYLTLQYVYRNIHRNSIQP